VEIFGAQLVNSIATGSIYALLVMGFNLLLVVGGVFQFAYPHIVVMSMYACWMVLERTGGNVFLGILAAIGAGVAMSLGTEPMFRPLARRGAALASFIVSLSIAMIIADVMSRFLNWGLPIAFPVALSGEGALVQYGIATITAGQLATIVGSVSAMLGFLYLLYRTRQGRALRVMAQNPSVARLLGIPITRMSMSSYIIAGLLGGVSAVFLAMAIRSASCTLGDTLALKVLAVALFAGLGNLRGGLIAAYILGLAEGMTLAYLPGDWANAIAFGMIIVVVMVRPQGLFGMRA